MIFLFDEDVLKDMIELLRVLYLQQSLFLVF